MDFQNFPRRFRIIEAKLFQCFPLNNTKIDLPPNGSCSSEKFGAEGDYLAPDQIININPYEYITTKYFYYIKHLEIYCIRHYIK